MRPILARTHETRQNCLLSGDGSYLAGFGIGDGAEVSGILSCQKGAQNVILTKALIGALAITFSLSADLAPIGCGGGPCPILPDITAVLDTGIGTTFNPTAQTKVQYSVGTISDFGFNSSASASIDLQPDPRLTAAVSAGYLGASAFYPSYLGATASLGYYFDVEGPSGQTVPITLTGVVDVDVSGTGYNVSPGGEAFLGYGNLTNCIPAPSIEPPGTCAFTLKEDFPSDTVQLVSISANAGAQGASFCPSEVPCLPEVVTVTVDPILSIDPSFADAGAFTIAVSSGIGNSPPSVAPEPSLVIPLSIALLAMVFLARPRKKLS
jgi:hypothetical protein